MLQSVAFLPLILALSSASSAPVSTPSKVVVFPSGQTVAPTIDVIYAVEGFTGADGSYTTESILAETRTYVSLGTTVTALDSGIDVALQTLDCGTRGVVMPGETAREADCWALGTRPTGTGAPSSAGAERAGMGVMTVAAAAAGMVGIVMGM